MFADTLEIFALIAHLVSTLVMVVMDLFTRRIVGFGVAPTHALRRGGVSLVKPRPTAPAAPEACEYAQRPAVSMPSLAGELASPRDQGNQDRTLCALLSCVR